MTDQCSQEKWQTSVHITRQTLAHRRRDRPGLTSQDRQALMSLVTGQAVIQVCGGNDNDQTDNIHKQAGTELQGMWKTQTHSRQFALSFLYLSMYSPRHQAWQFASSFPYVSPYSPRHPAWQFASSFPYVSMYSQWHQASLLLLSEILLLQTGSKIKRQSEGEIKNHKNHHQYSHTKKTGWLQTCANAFC